MTDRPIIFSAPMVRTLLFGSKTMTRRIIKKQPPEGWNRHRWFSAPIYGWTDEPSPTNKWHKANLKYSLGDRLWVRETWADVNTSCGPGIGYKADGCFYQPEYDGEDFGAGPSFDYKKYPGNYTMWFSDLQAGSPGHAWRSPIHMPRWASRLALTVTSVKVERLQDISEEDAQAEGAPYDDGPQFPTQKAPPGSKHIEDGWDCARDWYADLWESLHGPDAWDANPYVAAISFIVERRNIDDSSK